MRPHYDPTSGEPEKVDNTNAIVREVLADIARAHGVDVSAVVVRMAADGKIAESDVDTAASRGWITAQDAAAAKVAMPEGIAREDANAALRDAIEAIEADDAEVE